MAWNLHTENRRFCYVPNRAYQITSTFFFILCIHVRAYLTRPKFITAFTCLCCERLLDVYNNILFKSFYKLHKTLIIFDNENDAYQLEIKDALEYIKDFFFHNVIPVKENTLTPPPLNKFKILFEPYPSAFKLKDPHFSNPNPPKKVWIRTCMMLSLNWNFFFPDLLKKKSILIHDCTIMCVYLL